MSGKLRLIAATTALCFLCGVGDATAGGALNLTGQWNGTSKGRTRNVTSTAVMTLGAPLGCCIYPVTIRDTATYGSLTTTIWYTGGIAMLSGNILTFMVSPCNAKKPPWTLVGSNSITFAFSCRSNDIVQDFTFTHQ